METKLNELLSAKVWLKSGAYLVIEKTEALYVIDVNSGKNISQKENRVKSVDFSRTCVAGTLFIVYYKRRFSVAEG